MMANQIDFAELAPKILRNWDFGKNWELKCSFIHLATGFINLETFKLTFTNYLDQLYALKLLEFKNSKQRCHFAKLFKKFAIKSKTEFEVSDQSLMDLMFQTYETFIKIDEFNLGEIVENVKGVIHKIFKSYSTLTGSGIGFVIDTILSKGYFDEYVFEMDFSYRRCFDTSKLPDLMFLDLTQISHYYPEYIRFYRSAGIVPDLMTERELMLIMNAFLIYIIDMRKNSGAPPTAVFAEPFTTKAEGGLPAGLPLSLFRRNLLDAHRLTKEQMFQSLFQLVYGILTQNIKDKLLKPNIFREQYAVFVFQRLADQVRTKAHSLAKQQNTKKRSASARPAKKDENPMMLTSGELQMIARYSVSKRLTIEDLIE